MAALQDRVFDILAAWVDGTLEREVRLDWLDRPGKIECGVRWPVVTAIYASLTEDAHLPETMPSREWRRVDAVLTRPGHPSQIIEFDETQHFNAFRATTFTFYPDDLEAAFPADQWLEACSSKRQLEGVGFARPRPPLFPMAGGRHRQRAFRDALADLLPSLHGFGPTIRIAEFEIRAWINSPGAAERLRALIGNRLDATPVAAANVVRLDGPHLAEEHVGGTAYSPRVTAADLQAGRLRLPAAAKPLFPAVRTDVTIVLRGTPMTVRYDPRLGPDRSRSAVLSVGRARLATLVAEDEVLRLTETLEGVRLD